MALHFARFQRHGPWVVLAMLLALVAPPATSVARAASRKAAASSSMVEALELAKAARKVYEAGQFSAAAELWRKAFRLDPSKPDYLYGVGRAEQKAGNFAKARAAFEQLLALLPASDPIAGRAQKAMAEMDKADKVGQVLNKAPADSEPPAGSPGPQSQPRPPVGPEVRPASLATPSTATATPPAGATSPARGELPGAVAHANDSANWAPWGAAGAAIAAAVGAAVFAGLAMSADSDAQAYRVTGTVEFDPARINQSDAAARVNTINDRWMIAGICGGAAVVSGAVGGWLWWKGGHPAKVSWTGTGLQLAWGWR